MPRDGRYPSKKKEPKSLALGVGPKDLEKISPSDRPRSSQGKGKDPNKGGFGPRWKSDVLFSFPLVFSVMSGKIIITRYYVL